ncbi:hypothetical protein [Blastococcus brunescens]|uniref:Uncharacterized protein n=1 Tax=Blastococcus brunescens TaxID=1564165 RepID=A0ABZ1AT74_9ACTN|nr:hypothetical protein [Blastococcus sp. BMG 8361]WRL61715.1 hypothetical protein U6N30_16375 [Blastococcus sp. BMG 8361]
MQAQVEDVRRQRDQARQSLRELTDRIGEALQAVAGMVPEDVPRTHVMRGNVAAEGAVPDAREEADVVVMVGRPAPFRTEVRAGRPGTLPARQGGCW